ncbi:MAG TPA: AarF/ABC1/UbiB kinase family protein [Bdellovibrionales bacterium]|nr:AarF/ABC1/UbiB kinase family protein [Bdellovibrionales bacterium]
MPQKKAPLQDIRASLLTRGFALAKAGIRAGRMAAQGSTAQIEFLVKELGQLKGTAMKVGQTLSMYGEHLLPPEANAVLKKLQSESPPLAWPAIEQQLLAELGDEKLSRLEIEKEPMAAASIGQVHGARLDGEELAIKIQYPGIDQAVATDLKLLKFILNMSELVPRGPRFDQIFSEISEMFRQEIDYVQELKATKEFRELIGHDAIVPRVYPEFSTRKILAQARVRGLRADSPEVQALSQDRRNRLGLAYLRIYMRELFEFNWVQTDPHLGNYLVQIDREGENDKLALLDFGATRAVPGPFLECYELLVRGGLARDPRMIEQGGRKLGLLKPEDELELVDDYVKLCSLLTEPFQGEYDWGTSDLPKRVAAQALRIASTYKLRAPPRELIFLDRKLGGVFVFLSVLKCVMDARPVVEAALTRPR